ncbi:MAG: hypothetical protein INQ03_13720 [Candidatus Heimdallarchaeota archaeon]|nr:hypothetical protein [Candidatus Heimdallarchaeota archaeon]
MSDFISKTSEYIHSLFKFNNLTVTSASIAILQIATGDKFKTVIRSRNLNQYYLGIGEAGSGKSILIDVINDFAELTDAIFPFGTPQGISKKINGVENEQGGWKVHPQRSGVMIIDEVSDLFRSNRHLKDIFTLLSTLWSGNAKSWTTSTNGTVTIPQGTAISLFGTGTESLLKDMKVEHFTQGFGRRIIPIRFDGNDDLTYEEMQKMLFGGDDNPIPQELENFIRWIDQVDKFSKAVMSEEVKKHMTKLALEYQDKIVSTYGDPALKLRRLYLRTAKEFINVLAHTKAISELYIDNYTIKQYNNKYCKKTKNIFDENELHVSKNIEISSQHIIWASELFDQYYDEYIKLLNLWYSTGIEEKSVKNIEGTITIVYGVLERIANANGYFSMKRVFGETAISQDELHEVMKILRLRGVIKVIEGERQRYKFVRDIDERALIRKNIEEEDLSEDVKEETKTKK